ncbi:hypothetical protein DAEQUDRAFT_734137 [Daedalea quercina L-15889]|uniref:Uncharacterized protein n=1 Tax=Daedalea quercina L-15889 TaxID=1314783 RepID=A0A165KHW9_9APHY|nr:hypothetical protein DAEQUDRAFT_734137 [Daedalea quercina L-15889]
MMNTHYSGKYYGLLLSWYPCITISRVGGMRISSIMFMHTRTSSPRRNIGEDAGRWLAHARCVAVLLATYGRISITHIDSVPSVKGCQPLLGFRAETTSTIRKYSKTCRVLSSL